MENKSLPIFVSFVTTALIIFLIVKPAVNDKITTELGDDLDPITLLDNQQQGDATVNQQASKPNQPQQEPPSTTQVTKPEMTIDSSRTYTAVLGTTEGDITVELNAETTPITVNNFVHLARSGFYDSTIFHRTLSGFMIQGGDPEGTGAGGPGYRFNDEPFEGEYLRGVIAMANSGPNTNGSQFFIMHADYPLPPNYVIFGKVTSGLDAVDTIATAPVTSNGGGENSKPVTPVTVTTVTITEE